MVSFKGRSGPIIKTVTRTVSDIIFDSIEDTKIDYTNYYYEPTKNSNPYFFDEFKTGTPFHAIRSSMLWNNLELDIENAHYTLNSVIRNPSGWYTKFDRPPVESYISLFDSVYPGKFSNIDNLDIDKRPAQTIVLSGNNILDEARVTATKPFKHFHGNWNGTAINANSAFHFSLSKQDFGQNDDTILTVYVYRSVVSYETAIVDLNRFYSKISSTKVAEYDFSCTGDPYWQQKTINLQDLDIPDGDCLLWLEIVRKPSFSAETFNYPWNLEEINRTWYNYSHDARRDPSNPVYPSLQSSTTGWNIDTGNNTIQANLDPNRASIGFVSGQEYEDYIFESVVKSSSDDDDAIGLVIGFVWENGHEYTLTAYRSQGGPLSSKTWFVVANAGNAVDISGTNFSSLGSPLHYDVWDNSSSVLDTAQGWGSSPNGTKIRIEKTGNQVKVYTSQMNDIDIDLNTEIVINLTGHNARFQRSNIGFASWGQPMAHFHNIYLNNNRPAISIQDADVGVGGFGLEQSNKREYFANPKGNRYFIEEYHHEKFIDETSSNIIIESFNSHDSTLSAFEEISNKSLYKIENIFISKQSVLLTITGNDYTENGTIGNWKPVKFLQTSTSKYLETNPFLEYQPGIPLKNWGGMKSIDISQENQQISFQGITYNFESSSGYISDGSELIRQESYFSWHMQSFDPLNLDYKTELSRAVHYSSPTTHDIFQESNGLFSMRSIDRSPERLLQFGPPTDIAKPISKFGLGNPKNNFYKNNQFFDLLSNHDYKDDKFIEITKNTSLGEIVWKETIKVLNFDFSKTAYFEYHKPIELSVNVFYTPVLDKPFIHKVFFVNFETKKLNFKPFIQSPKTSYLIEQNYLHTMISTAKGSKNKFKHLMIEELYRPGYKNLDQVYEFVMLQFEVVSSTQFDYKKFGYTFYEPITTKRPGLSGGSNAFGHDLLTIDKRQDIASNFKTFSMDEMIENNFGAAGRGGRHRSTEYREIHILDRYEYTSIDYDLETHTTYDPDAPVDIEDETFNWVYTIDDDPNNGRIPECLKLEGNRIIGEFTDTDKFLRQYSWETWMKTQGTTDDSGNFVSLSDTLDFDYTDFDLIPLRQWEVNITGKSITKGTIDLVYDGVELTTGDVLTQTIGDVESRFEIVRKISEFDKVSDRSTGSLSYEVIHRYEVENIRGDIEVTTLEETFTETFVSGESVLQSEKTRVQEELLFSTGIRKSILQKRIEDLTNTIAENLITNPTGYGFISKIPSGKQIDINYVTNEEKDLFLVDDFVQIGSGSVSKFIKIIFKIRNNWSFDRDLRLFTDDSIVDTEFSTRTKWVNAQRENNRAVWIPSINNTELDLTLVEFIKNYDIGTISIDDFISERDFIIDSRDFSTPDQKTEYKEFLDTIIFINLKSGKWENDVNIINTLTGDHISNLFPISDSKDRGERFDTISQTENGEQVYKLNCSVNVDEQTFYDNIDAVQVIRGYPIYASCN